MYKFNIGLQKVLSVLTQKISKEPNKMKRYTSSIARGAFCALGRGIVCFEEDSRRLSNKAKINTFC